MKFDILNRFTRAVQFTAEIECHETELTSVKIGLSVKWALESSADLRYADLSYADLRYADLRGQWIIQGPTRSDGYMFSLTNLTGEGVRIKAGCRDLPLMEAIEHWRRTRDGTALGNETYAIINHLVELAFLRGLIDKNCEAVK